MMGNNPLYFGGGNFDLVGLFIILFWIFAFVDVVLLAFWLWRQLQKR